MKKRIISVISLSLVGAMLASSLTGCGTQAKATDVTVEDGDTIIVEGEDTESTDDDAITSTEVIGGSDEAADFAGAEDDNIVLYAEIEKYGKYMPFTDVTFEAADGIVSANENVPIYNEDGVEVGYIKNGSIISISDKVVNMKWSRFVNPIAGTGYDYLYVMNDYVTKGKPITLSDAEEIIEEALSKRGYDAPTFVSNTDGMEMYEFRIPSYYEESEFVSGPEEYVEQFFMQRDDSTEDGMSIRFYKTYAVVCSEDTDGYIICQVYYKDAITEEEWKAVQ